MKWIKRVAVSPIPATSGAVIDSFNATDKTTNAPSIRAVEDKLSYSAEEKVAGEWFGKPLYRKIIDFGVLPNATSRYVSHGISNIDTFATIRGIATNGTNFFPLPYSYSSPSSTASQYSITLYATKTEIVIEVGSNRESYSGKVILEYTKTTD